MNGTTKTQEPLTTLASANARARGRSAGADAVPASARRRPGSISFNPLVRLASDLVSQRRVGSYPEGPLDFNLRRSQVMARDPLTVLMPLYERWGPVFSVRVLHSIEVFMIGPEANHLILVSGRDDFSWREGSLRELIPLLGDGLLTTDGIEHDRAREILMPAFHSARILDAAAEIRAEAERAIDDWRPGGVVDIYEWSRATAIRIAMRALLGLDPDDRGAGAAAAHHFERALRYYGTDFHLRMLRGPGTPWNQMLSSKRALDRIISTEIGARRASVDGRRDDILALLVDASSEAGERLSEREIRDQTLTLLFAGHDTMTSTLSFLFYELARHPEELARVVEEIDGPAAAAAEDAIIGRFPALHRCIEETLRLYPPAWIGPRRALRSFEFAGSSVPAGASVNYSSLLTHRLPDLFEDPLRFDPDRFRPEARAQIPPGGYVPFGAGPRICIGKRFALAEAEVIAATILRRFRPELLDDRPLRLRPMPTLGPRGGLKMRLDRA